MPKEPRGAQPNHATLTVEATANIDGQPLWMDVGLGRILRTATGKKVRMKLGAVPDNHEIYISVADVLRLSAKDDLEAPLGECDARRPDRPMTH